MEDNKPSLMFERKPDALFDWPHDYKYDVFEDGESGGYLCTIHKAYRKHGTGWAIDNGGLLNTRNNWFDTLKEAKEACRDLSTVYILRS